MGNIIGFHPQEEELSLPRLKACLSELRKELQALDAREPRDMESEAYEDWAEEHEALEDAIDEILDQLDAAEE